MSGIQRFNSDSGFLDRDEDNFPEGNIPVNNPHQALPHIPEEEEDSSSNTTTSSDSFYSDEMAEPAVITGSQLACRYPRLFRGERSINNFMV